MSRHIRLVIIAAATDILLALAVFLLRPPAADSGKQLVFRDSPPADVAEVTIRNEYGEIKITPRDGGYIVGDIPADLVDRPAFINLMTRCGAVSAVQAVASGDDAQTYMGDKPLASVDISYTDKTSLTLTIGKRESVTGDFYGRVSGEKGVYLFKKEAVQHFLAQISGLVDHAVTPGLQLQTPLSAIRDVTFTGGALPAPVTLKAVAGGDEEITEMALSFGAPTHIIKLNGVYELDQTYGADMLGSLLGVTATDILGYLNTPTEMAAFGFDKPYMSVDFDLKNAVNGPVVHYRLDIIQKDGVYYAARDNNGVIYEIPKPKFLDVDYQKLPVRWFVKPLIIDISAVELDIRGNTLSFAVTGESGGDKRVTCNGKDMDMGRFRQFYQILTSAAGDGSLIDGAVKASGEPIMTLRYSYPGARKKPDTLRIYAFDALRDYAEVNGVVESSMRASYVTCVQNAVDILDTDKPFETQW